MLKRKLAVSLLALAPLAMLPLSAHADPDAGCGAGSKIWAGQHGTIYKIFAATTNGSFGNQTFGMSSGTLGCHQGGTVTSAAARIPMFARANIDQLASDMAAGHGEALTALASLYGIDASDRASFDALVQAHYQELFPSAETNSNAVINSLNALMKADAQLARYAV